MSLGSGILGDVGEGSGVLCVLGEGPGMLAVRFVGCVVLRVVCPLLRVWEFRSLEVSLGSNMHHTSCIMNHGSRFASMMALV